MTARFIVRLLTADGTLLGWSEVFATAKPQDRPAASCPFWPDAPTEFPIERDGEATQISVHWADLDVARVEALSAPVPVRVGERRGLPWLQPVWLVPGMRDVPLPGVTVGRPVTIGVPVGALVGRS
jgi:hypothetical protein